jgi:uncharacterized protein (TIGR03067 family)
MLRRFLCAVVTVVIGLGAAMAGESDAKQALTKLQGTWAVEKAADNYEKVLVIKEETGALTNTLTTDTGRITSTFNFTLKLNPEKNPSQIDLLGTALDQGEAKIYLGIYSLKGDTLKLRWNQPGKARPAGFSSKADHGTELIFKKKT